MMMEDFNWPEYLHNKLEEQWNLSPTCRENCEVYLLRHWDTSYFSSQITNRDNVPYINYQGTMYKVILRDVKCITEDQCALSFRKPKPELNLPAYVLVKGIT